MAACEAFDAEDIVKYGNMMIKRPPTSTKVRIKAWQSKFFVLRDESQHSTQKLEYYKDETAFVLEKKQEHCLFLDSIVYIGETHRSKTHHFALMVVCSKQGAFTLACDTAEDLKDWLQALNKVAVKVGGTASCLTDTWAQSNGDVSPATTPELARRAGSPTSNTTTSEASNSVQPQASSATHPDTSTTPGYLVTTRLTPLSEKNHIRGDYIMCITNGHVTLQSTNDRSQTVVTWPVIYLRAFKSEHADSSGMKDMRLLTLNVGRRSPTGEGILQFFTKLGDNIANEIRLQSNYYVSSKTAADKRDAFRRRSGHSGSQDTRSPPSVASRKLPRTMTAPSERFASVIKREGSPLMDPARKRAGTDPIAGNRIEECIVAEENRQSAASEPDLQLESVSSDESRSRSATDSSVEKGGDDEVFLSRTAEEEQEATGVAGEESEPSAYIDLIGDENAEPVHIPDPVPRRKISSESQVSCASAPSEEGSPRSCSLPRHFAGNQYIAEENETDSEGYIKCEALHTGPPLKAEVNNLDGNGNVLESFAPETGNLDQVCLISANQGLSSCSFSSPPAKKAPSLKYLPGGVLNQKLRENLVAQIQDPSSQNGGIFPPRPNLERERALTSECVFPPRTRGEGEESQPESRMEVGPRQALLEKLKDPESSKKLFDQFIAQIEKPQQNDVNELFPAQRHQKRNSIGAVSTETVREVQQKASVSGGKASLFIQKKHAVIEKSNSTCDGLALRGLHPGPPPLPVRPDPTVPYRKRASSSSMSDIFEDMHRRADLFGGDRPTFFAKGMRNKNPTGPVGPLRNTIPATLGGEAAISARILERTEIRDEGLAQCSTSTKKFQVNEVQSCSILNGGSVSVSREETCVRSIAVAKSMENLDSRVEEETHSGIGRRKDSRASKIVKKIWKNLSPQSESQSKHSPKPRRGSNGSRVNEDVSEDDSERPRRASLSPGDAIVFQGRFTESESSTPETSPQSRRKSASKSPEKPERKTSNEEKARKDDDSPKGSRRLSSATRMLRKVSKAESKKDECSSRNAAKTNSTSPVFARDDAKVEIQKKDHISTDNATKRPVPPTSSPKPPKTEKQTPHLPPKMVGEQSRDENCLENAKGNDTACQQDSGLPLNAGGSDNEPLPSEDGDDDSAPALPPRKKSDPPPLPPRRAKSSPSFSSNAIPASHSGGHHSGRPSQSGVSSSREGRRHSGSKGVCSLPKEEFLPPPPVPPRKENSRSPSPKSAVVNERSSARAPVIQLTCSSPENKQDAEEQNSELEEDTTAVTPDKGPEEHPPNLSSNHQSPDSLSHPVPRRPPKGERRTQAKEFFRSRGTQGVCNTTSDSECVERDAGSETEGDDFPPNSPRYGNINDFRNECNANYTSTSTSDEAGSCHMTEASSHLTLESRHVTETSSHVSVESCHVTESSGRASLESCRAIESQKEAVRLKVNLLRESSFEETF